MTNYYYDTEPYYRARWDNDYDPPPRPTFSLEEYKVGTDKIYTHINGYKYTLHKDQLLWPGQTYCIPFPGQGMDCTPRYLATGNLRDEDGCVPPVVIPGAPFKPGDIVRLKTGTAPIRVTSCNTVNLNGEYLSGNHKVQYRSCYDFELHPDFNEKETNTMANAQTLYQFNIADDQTFEPKQHFGHHIGTNSLGQWIMEIKGTGKVVAVDKSTVEEVLPYTVGVKFLGGGNSTVYSYFSEKGKFEPGFYLYNDRDGNAVIVQLVAVDTKSKSATEDFAPIGKLAVDMY
jgi:hypothetical protein